MPILGFLYLHYGEGPLALFEAHSLSNIADAADGSDTYIHKPTEQDYTEEMRRVGLSLNGLDMESPSRGYAVSCATIVTLSANGIQNPADKDITAKRIGNYTHFGTLVPATKEPIVEDSRFRITFPKGKGIDGDWFCRSRSGIIHTLTTADIVIAAYQPGMPVDCNDVPEGSILYQDGIVTELGSTLVKRCFPNYKMRLGALER